MKLKKKITLFRNIYSRPFHPLKSIVNVTLCTLFSWKTKLFGYSALCPCPSYYVNKHSIPKGLNQHID